MRVEPIPDGMKNGNDPYRVTAFRNGNSVVLVIPSDALDYFGLAHLKEDEDADPQPMRVQKEEGQYGRYGSFWNPEQQQTEEE